MVAAQGGETRDTDARTGGGVSGRFRLLGGGAGSGEAPDTTPPAFGTAPWGYRRSEVDAWASWVAGLVAHGRNETVRADSAEATLRATLERLEQLERPVGGDAPSHGHGAPGADSTSDLPRPRAGGRLDVDPPADLPRRVGGGTRPPGPQGPDDEAHEAGPPDDPEPDDPARAGTEPATSTATAAQGATHSATHSATHDATHDAANTHDPPHDHDLARLHVVETTLHEVLGLLHHLAGRT